jgi:hydroxymethylpyrimidine kinase/phosphomethylpyrimidine kinase
LIRIKGETMARQKSLQTKTLLSIAGYDPSSGAGVTLDLAVFRKIGFDGMGILTAATAQNTKRVVASYAPPSRFLFLQYQTLRREVSFSGVKTGMVGHRKNIPVISRILGEHRGVPIVVDPALRASSGAWLLEKAAIPYYISHLKGKISVITPNLEEAGLISGRKVRNLEEMKEAASAITDIVAAPCLVKGGHLSKGAVDLLFDGRRYYVFEKGKLNRDVHGTGCFLSSSLLCFLVKGYPLAKACELASAFTHAAIKKAVKIGRGKPVFSPLL